MLETMGSNLPRSYSGMEREIARSLARYVAEVELGSWASSPHPVLFPRSHRLDIHITYLLLHHQNESRIGSLGGHAVEKATGLGHG